MVRVPKRLTAVACALGLLGLACAELPKLPTLSQEDLDRIVLAQSSKIYDSEDNLITTLHGPEDRTVIPLKQIPEHVQEAVIAIEDERFYEHDGVDWRAVLRAAAANFSAGEIREGGSTITQQYVKNAIIAPGEIAEKTLDRKLKEAALARQLEKRITKKEILERYLNTVYFGQGAYGIQAAAQTFFGKTAKKLTLAEGAVLAGMIRSPEQYDPFDNKAASKERRNLVINKMLELGWIETAKAEKAINSKLRLLTVEQKDTYPAPYFVDYVQRLITYDPRFDMLGETTAERTKTLFQGGLRIETTIDMDKQDAAEDAIHRVLPNASDPHASLVAINPRNGHVEAMVGGRNWFASRKEDPYAKLNLSILAEPDLGCVKPKGQKKCENRAPGTGRQAGSAFKTFALADAIRSGVSLVKRYEARSTMVFPGADAGGDWTVRNYESSDFGKNLPLLEATVNSVNVVYAQLILEIGPSGVVQLAEDMGIRTDLDPVPSAVLGANPVNPLGMASAYATLGAAGKYRPPTAITRIVAPNGKVLYDVRDDPSMEAEQALSPVVAYLTTSALQQVIERGTGFNARIGRPAAGKTGTAQEYRDAWFAGYTPDLAAAVWLGYPEGEIEMKPVCYVRFENGIEVCRETRTITSGGVTGGSFPALIWQAFMLRALSDTPATPFDAPTFGIVTVTIDTRCGLLANRFTPDEFRETAVLPEGTVPKKSCRVPGDRKKVENVIGFPVEDAIRILEDDGFEVVVEKEPSTTYPPGRVIAQKPGGGEKAPKGSTVVLTVSAKGEPEEDDTAEVPNVLGYKRSAAEAAIRQAGFEVRVIYQKESDPDAARKRKGRVWKQSPAGGSEAERGSVVTIWVNPD